MRKSGKIKRIGLYGLGLACGISSCVLVQAAETEWDHGERNQPTPVEVAEETEELNYAEEILEIMPELQEESTQLLDMSPETEVRGTEYTMPETGGIFREESETEMENSSPEAESPALPLKFEVKNQTLEAGKTFDDILVPEWAVAEDGSKVTGEVIWQDPASGITLDSDMEISGEDGESMVWKWVFEPDNSAGHYQKTEGMVELTIAAKRTTGNGSSGMADGATSIREASSIEEAAGWMGSSTTGVGAIGRGNHSDVVQPVGEEEVNAEHGTVRRETEAESGAETEGTSQMETGSGTEEASQSGRTDQTESTPETEGETEDGRSTDRNRQAESAQERVLGLFERETTGSAAQENALDSEKGALAKRVAQARKAGRTGAACFVVSQICFWK